MTTHNDYRFHVGTLKFPHVFTNCFEQSSDVVEHFRGIAKDVEETAANNHDATCEHCQADLANGVQPDCLGMDESTNASAMLSSIADGDLLYLLDKMGAGGAACYTIGEETYWVLVCVEFDGSPCRETVPSR